MRSNGVLDSVADTRAQLRFVHRTRARRAPQPAGIGKPPVFILAANRPAPPRAGRERLDARDPCQRRRNAGPLEIGEHTRGIDLARHEASLEQRANLRFRAGAVGLRERLQVQPVEQLAMNVRLQLEVLRAQRLNARGASRGSRSGRGG